MTDTPGEARRPLRARQPGPSPGTGGPAAALKHSFNGPAHRPRPAVVGEGDHQGGVRPQARKVDVARDAAVDGAGG